MQNSCGKLRIKWIDTLRGFCMAAILLDHTEFYYVGSNIIPTTWYIPNVLALFFLISGYLFYKPVEFNLKAKVLSILRGLLFPYFIFTFFIGICKNLFYSGSIHVLSLLEKILWGYASWFIASLIVAELLFSVLLHFSQYSKWVLVAGSVACMFLSIIFNQLDVFGTGPGLWNFIYALLMVFYLYMGYSFNEHNAFFKRIQNLYVASASGLLFVILKCLEMISIHAYSLEVSSLLFYVFLFLETICIFFTLYYIFSQIKKVYVLPWIGMHCIVFYFLNGGVANVIVLLLHKADFFYNGAYLHVLVVFFLVIFVNTILTYMIYKYVPSITGRKDEK